MQLQIPSNTPTLSLAKPTLTRLTVTEDKPTLIKPVLVNPTVSEDKQTLAVAVPTPEPAVVKQQAKQKIVVYTTDKDNGDEQVKAALSFRPRAKPGVLQTEVVMCLPTLTLEQVTEDVRRLMHLPDSTQEHLQQKHSSDMIIKTTMVFAHYFTDLVLKTDLNRCFPADSYEMIFLAATYWRFNTTWKRGPEGFEERLRALDPPVKEINCPIEQLMQAMPLTISIVDYHFSFKNEQFFHLSPNEDEFMRTEQFPPGIAVAVNYANAMCNDFKQRTVQDNKPFVPNKKLKNKKK